MNVVSYHLGSAVVSDRDFDLVLQGATGFTGRIAAAELARRAPAELRWGIAGRDRERVEALAGELGVPSLVADGLDPEAIDTLAASSRVVISCAGPFARYGDELVRACARHRTHYADLTGELPWIERVAADVHAACAESGTAIVPCSGFDSVPTDLGVLALARELGELGEVRGFFRLRGGLNGGTLHSGLALAEAGELRSMAAPGPRVFRAPALGGWAAPFLMAPVNEWVVRRSAAQLAARGAGHGAGFAYREHALERGRLRAHALSGALRIADVLFATAAGRALLRTLGPAPGQGPSERSIESGFAELTLVAGNLESPDAVRVWRWDGDPSNRITTRCLVQVGLALAAGEARAGGVLTPASALGEGLLERLLETGAVLPAERFFARE